MKPNKTSFPEYVKCGGHYFSLYLCSLLWLVIFGWRTKIGFRCRFSLGIFFSKREEKGMAPFYSCGCVCVCVSEAVPQITHRMLL